MENHFNLKASEMGVLSAVFLECLEAEKLKLSEKQKLDIDVFIIQFVSTTKLHTLFTENGLKTLTEYIFTNVDFRDFIFCLSDQFSCITALNDLENRKIEASIAFGLNQVKEKQSYNLIPERIENNIQMDGQFIYEILIHNKWLTVLILIYLFFQKTNLFNILNPAPKDS